MERGERGRGGKEEEGRKREGERGRGRERKGGREGGIRGEEDARVIRCSEKWFPRLTWL